MHIHGADHDPNAPAGPGDPNHLVEHAVCVYFFHNGEGKAYLNGIVRQGQGFCILLSEGDPFH